MDCVAIALLALMVQSEAPFEPLDGKVAVAYVAMNRATMSGRPLQTILTQPKQFKLDLRRTVSESSWLAARTAFHGLQPDPTQGADHFYNALVQPWPIWYDETRITVRIGNHSFLNLGGF